MVRPGPGDGTSGVMRVVTGIDDEHAADVFVRRRRLHEKDHQKALAALARQGFAFDVARRALAQLGYEQEPTK